MSSTTLSALVDIDRLRDLVREHYINVTAHPSGGLWIFNYSPKTQYEGLWIPETMLSRGLIVAGTTPDDPDNLVLARPFPKFHNASEHMRAHAGLEPLPLDSPVVVTAKMDGSLGILYPSPSGGYAVATRGSFASDQAIWATAHFASKYASQPIDPELTYLFEIIYPENRIVVDYHGLTDLVLLATIETATGCDVDLPANWPGPIVEHFDFADLNQLINTVDEAPIEVQGSAEGFVARFESGLRVKVKYAEYVRLHRIITNLNTRIIYEHAGVQALTGKLSPKEIGFVLSMSADDVQSLADTPGGPIAELIESVPDELYDWVDEQITALNQAASDALKAVEAAYQARPIGATGVEMAKYVKASGVDTSALFNMINNKVPDGPIWKRLRPAFARPTASLVDEE